VLGAGAKTMTTVPAGALAEAGPINFIVRVRRRYILFYVTRYFYYVANKY